MKKLTREEAAQIKTKPNGRVSRTRLYLMMMQPGEIILLERLDWTLLLDGRDTVSGAYDRNLLLPSGRTVDLPLQMELDLLEFFRESQDGLASLALDVAGGRGTGDRLELRARPTISTPLGPIRYPGEIVIRP